MSLPHVEIRPSTAADARWSQSAADLIADASDEFDIARRSPTFLGAKIESGQAALAFCDGNLVGFGYYSDWEGGRFVSHSGLVVKPDYRGHGLGRRLKLALFEASKQRFPQAVLMSMTRSPEVKAMNLQLGFRVVPIDAVTNDPAFWEGCKQCRRFAEAQTKGLKCCAEAMIFEP